MKRRFLLVFLLLSMFTPLAMMGQQTMTVYDGGLSNDHIPAYIYYFDGYTRSQFVIPASSLPTMANGTISAIKFYTDLEAVPYPSSGVTAAPVDVYLMEVDYTSMTDFESKSDATIVYSGTLSIVADGDGGSMTIDFNTPYAYGGGNLLIGIENTSSAGWQHVYFLGQTVNGAAWSGNGSSPSNIRGSAVNFIPKTTFTYTPAGSLDAIIGTGTTTGNYTPLFGNYKSSYDQMIYTKAQIQDLGITQGASISKIGFDAASANPLARNVVIYMGQTDKNSFNDNSDFVSINELTKVYDYNDHSPWDITTGWNEFVLDTPFDFDGEGNLVIAMHCGWIESFASTAFYCTQTPNQAIYAYSDNQDLDPIPTVYEDNWGNYNGSKFITAQLPNLKFTYTVIAGPSCAKPTLDDALTTTTSTANLSWTENGTATEWEFEYSTASDFADAVSVNVSSTPALQLMNLPSQTTYYARVKALCSSDDESNWSNVVSFDTKCDAITTFPWTEDFNALTVANSIPEFWDNSEGTTTNSSYKWCYNTNTSGNGATNGTSHDGSKCIRFNSFMNGNGKTNFLKTPTLNLSTLTDATLSFWYKNPKGGDFSVYISTDGGITYTTALATGLIGQTEWTELTIDISAFAGQEKVAIVFKGTSNYGNGNAYIYLDDVTIDGTNPNGNISYTPQTIALSEGSNWVSFHVETTLEDLQDALVAALPGTNIMIQGEEAYTTYSGTRWRGPLTTLDVSRMYMIAVTSDCEITLEAMPLNPTEHPITITNGSNWIGFPLNTEMTVNEAFAGFAVQGDIIQSHEGYATYNGTNWRGSLTTLRPGQGYVYTSASTNVRTLVYPYF